MFLLVLLAASLTKEWVAAIPAEYHDMDAALRASRVVSGQLAWSYKEQVKPQKVAALQAIRLQGESILATTDVLEADSTLFLAWMPYKRKMYLVIVETESRLDSIGALCFRTYVLIPRGFADAERDGLQVGSCYAGTVLVHRDFFDVVKNGEVLNPGELRIFTGRMNPDGGSFSIPYERQKVQGTIEGNLQEFYDDQGRPAVNVQFKAYTNP